MSGIALLDTNLLVLLVMGSADVALIDRHRRLRGYRLEHFQLLRLLLADFDEILVVPHVLAETSNLVGQAGDRVARDRGMATLQHLIELTRELPVSSRLGGQRGEFGTLGLTDAVLLHLCADGEVRPTLITVDADLADAAHSLGYEIVDFRRDYMAE